MYNIKGCSDMNHFKTENLRHRRTSYSLQLRRKQARWYFTKLTSKIATGASPIKFGTVTAI